MSENYFYQDDEKEIIREELLTTKALDWAKSFVNPVKTSYNRQKGQKEIRDKNKLTNFQKEILKDVDTQLDLFEKNPQLSSAQLRRFYHDVKSLELKVKENFDKAKPLVGMLKSKVAYVCPKKGRERKIPLEFRKFLEEMVDSVNTEQDFSAFCLVFEAVVGYFYGEGGK